MANDMTKPILVTGSHRSGTTWVGKMISACPSVAYINEPFSPETYRIYRGRCGAKFIYWNTYVTDENEVAFYQHIKHTLEFRYNLRGQFNANRNFVDFKRTLKEYCIYWGYRSRNLVPLMKDPLAVFSAGWLAKKFDMNVLVLVRHPAAFVTSLKRLNWDYDFYELLQQPLLIRDYLYPFEQEITEYAALDNDIIDRAALLWKIIYSVVLMYQKYHPDWIYLRYEDIATNPIPCFKDLFNRFGLEFSDSVKATIQDYTSPSNSIDAPEGDWSLRKRNSQANVGSWKNKLTKDEITRIKAHVEEVSKEFYADEDWE
ncbi:sulfotransferase [Trichocoleus sp. FACHB-262]|uniref:sulfotransferase n=1 Tax=Trichocoleus sp. FACHB-262 TaxID=2692869 RepID=UPI001689871A|nr:sulfotransferase [Trichocoleus sp. FACHB-262]MBD2121677.1 sulfotransferase [Trichocoleus sp. FACHB-262]